MPHAGSAATTQRATHAEINLTSFRHNLNLARTALRPGVKTMAVVKADAYGHGALPCSKAALDAGADWLGVGILEEGLELRQHGIDAPVLVLGSVFPHEIDALIRGGLSTILSDYRLARALSRQAARAGKTVGVHIKVDTGMGRLGVLPEDFLCLVERVLERKNLRIEAVSTHFSSADEDDPEFTLSQLSRFNRAVEQLRAAGRPVPLLHCANSSALIKFPQTWFDMVRPGLILYGALPSPKLKPHLKNLAGGGELLPVMQWKSRIIQINRIPKGSGLSYGKNHVVSRDSLIATLPAGYADGLSRNLSGKMNVLIRGRKARQVGTICMDMCLIDVTDIPEAQVGDEAVILGRQGQEAISAEELAQQNGTVPYEILCAVSKRVPRVYLP
ncbi:MAG: alanine racemase [Nitrospinae bacterium]|nr:alanine racemase [Nitrospinota bacterium]